MAPPNRAAGRCPTFDLNGLRPRWGSPHLTAYTTSPPSRRREFRTGVTLLRQLGVDENAYMAAFSFERERIGALAASDPDADKQGLLDRY